MNTKLVFTLVLSALASTASAQNAHAPGHSHHAPAANTVAEEWVAGEVRRVDREQGRLTLRHGEIRSLDMPPMTMVFDVADPSVLDTLAPGDQVRFRVVADGNRYRITALERR